MKIGIVGYQGAGKSSLFQWLTGQEPDPSLSHSTQMASTPVPDQRVPKICDIFQPKKTTLASLNIVDTPGLDRSHEGSAAKLALIREAGCLVIVVGAYAGADPAKDLQSFEDDLLIADLDIVSNRVEKLKESVKKPRPTRDKEMAELEALQPIVEHLENGKALHEIEMTAEQERATRSFQLLTPKPRFVVVNISDDQTAMMNASELTKVAYPSTAVSITLQLELAQLDPDERSAFCEEMGVTAFDRDALIREVMLASRQMLFFTAGEKEVRTWMIPKGATAEDAAGSIHSDLARGFVRAETMNCTDLFECGSEREVKAQNRMRKEPRDYVIQDGDILHILAST